MSSGKRIKKEKDIVKKITVLTLCTMLFALCYPAQAQQAKKIPRIGFLHSAGRTGSLLPNFKAFQQGLHDLGYTEGRNLLIEHRYGEGRLDHMASLVNELLQQKVDVIVVSNQVAIRAAKKATKTVPIIIVSSVDPVAAGHVDSLGHPGGNITGLSRLSRDLSAKRVELLKEVVPSMSRLAVLWDPDGPGPTVAFKEYETAARQFKLHLQSLEVRGPKADIDGAFEATKKGSADALIIVSNPLIIQHRKRIIKLAMRERLPTMSEGSRYVRAGALLSYAANTSDLFRRGAWYVDKILKGAKPGDLPIEQPTKFEMVINLKTAKQIGLTIPETVLYRADKVIR